MESKMKQIEHLIAKYGVPQNVSGKLANLEPHPECLVEDPEDIVHLDWSNEIHHDLP
jgi:hypothetical protein